MKVIKKILNLLKNYMLLFSQFKRYGTSLKITKTIKYLPDINHEKDILTLIFGYISEKFMLKEFKWPNIQIMDREMSTRWINAENDFHYGCGSWYLGDVPYTLKKLKKIIKKNHFKKIVLLGTSKSAYAALLYSSLLSKDMSSLKISCVAFSPSRITKKENCFFSDTSPAFNKIIAHNKLNEQLEKYYDINKYLKNSKIQKNTIIYSQSPDFQNDFETVKYLREGSLINEKPIDYKVIIQKNIPVHYTITYIWKHKRNELYKIIEDSFK